MVRIHISLKNREMFIAYSGASRHPNLIHSATPGGSMKLYFEMSTLGKLTSAC